MTFNQWANWSASVLQQLPRIAPRVALGITKREGGDGVRGLRSYMPEQGLGRKRVSTNQTHGRNIHGAAGHWEEENAAQPLSAFE